jgi:STIP1 family protein 1|uniref:E3 ubiquitin-protein ligase CHIP n=1 Tax=Picea sitchensis TaxID=3332 RepID=D5AA55_PICSI|nr:unknown [Picea sitchensis]
MAPGLDVPVNVAKQAEILKQDGNTYFKKDRLGAAIEAYTQAITLCPNVTVYWTNRALCHRKRDDWEKVEADCRKALELDVNSVKAHYMLGLALLQHKQYADGVKQLEKALELGRGANPSSYMVEEIWQELAKAKYLEWESTSRLRLQKQQELRAICERALQQELESTRMQDSETGIQPTTAPYHNGGTASTHNDGTESNDVEGESKSCENSLKVESEITYKERIKMLSDVFNKSAEADIPNEVPEYLCCKITLDIFRDPVITPSGVTYERAVILEHIRKVGNFDPITREPLKPEQLVPNLAIKEAVQDFLGKHGWAYKMT